MADFDDLTPSEIRWISDAIHPQAALRSATRLVGATSSDLFLCVVETPDERREVVLRRYADAEGKPRDTEMARFEAWALRTASGVSVPTPNLIAMDDSGIAEGRCPRTLMSRVPGRVVVAPQEMDPWLREMARAMYAIHQLAADDAPYEYFPYYDVDRLATQPWSQQPGAWERAFVIARGPAPSAARHFIHRDFHPCNVLFTGDRLSGVVDWVNSCRGTASVDVAHCRWNLALMHGVDAADRFVDMYREFAGSGWDYDPYYDMVELCEKLAWRPNIYPGWPANGMTWLTDALMLERTEALLLSALARR